MPQSNRKARSGATVDQLTLFDFPDHAAPGRADAPANPAPHRSLTQTLSDTAAPPTPAADASVEMAAQPRCSADMTSGGEQSVVNDLAPDTPFAAHPCVGLDGDPVEAPVIVNDLESPSDITLITAVTAPDMLPASCASPSEAAVSCATAGTAVNEPPGDPHDRGEVAAVASKMSALQSFTKELHQDIAGSTEPAGKTSPNASGPAGDDVRDRKSFTWSSEGIVPSPQEKKMVSVAKLSSTIKHMAHQGDHQPLRNAVKLIFHHKLSVESFAAMSEDMKVDYIEKFVAELNRRVKTGTDGGSCRVPVGMLEPRKLARAIHMAFFRLSLQLGGEGFPIVEAPADPWVHPYSFPAKGGPVLLKEQIDGWSPKIRGNKSAKGTGEAITEKTRAEYRTKVWQLVTFWTLAGLTVRPSLDLELLTERDSITAWLPKVTAHYSSKGIAPFLAGIKRVTTDVLGLDHPNVAALAATQRAESTDPDLPASQVEQLRDLTRPEEAASCCQIWDIADEIDKSAYGPWLKPSARDGRKSSAVAAEILLCTLSWGPEYLAGLNLDTDVRGAGANREIRSTNHSGLTEWRPLSTKACERIDDLKSLRRDLGRRSPWLFPNKGGEQPQTRQIAMTAFARNVSSVLSRPIRMIDIRDALVTNGVDSLVNDPKVIADAFGVDVRTIERRFSVLLKAALPPSEEAA